MRAIVNTKSMITGRKAKYQKFRIPSKTLTVPRQTHSVAMGAYHPNVNYHLNNQLTTPALFLRFNSADEQLFCVNTACIK